MNPLLCLTVFGVVVCAHAQIQFTIEEVRKDYLKLEEDAVIAVRFEAVGDLTAVDRFLYETALLDCEGRALHTLVPEAGRPLFEGFLKEQRRGVRPATRLLYGVVRPVLLPDERGVLRKQPSFTVVGSKKFVDIRGKVGFHW